MNKILKFGLIGVFLLFFGCNEKEEVNTLKIGKVMELKLGETVENSKLDLSLRVENINDSRCPDGVMCFWEGYASVEFQLTTKKGKYDFTLDTHNPPIFKNDTVIEGIKYELIDVLPYPVHNEEQPIKIIKFWLGGNRYPIDLDILWLD